jgi:hypothetical protein
MELATVKRRHGAGGKAGTGRGDEYRIPRTYSNSLWPECRIHFVSIPGCNHQQYCPREAEM